MKKAAIICAVGIMCLFPMLSRADCDNATKACDDAKAFANKCNVQWGFRAEVMCVDQNKASTATCAKASTECGGGSEHITTPSQRRNQ
jgi:hypothetical protein